MTEREEMVRRALAAAARRDREALAPLVSDSLRFKSRFAAAEGREFGGPDAIDQYFGALDEAFEEMRFDLLEVVAEQGDRLVVRIRVSGRGKGSGIEIDQQFGQVWTLRDGRVEAIDSYTDVEQALEEAAKQTNLEGIRAAAAAWNGGDESFAEAIDPDIVVVPPQGWPEGGEVHGREAWLRQLRRLRDSWGNARLEIDEMEALDTERVRVRFRYVTAVRGSGHSFETRFTAHYTVRDGLTTRIEYFRED